MSLDKLVGSARSERPNWDEARAGRVFSATLAANTTRAVRAKVVRRTLVAMSSVGVIVLVVFRVAGASAPEMSETTSAHDTIVAAHVESSAFGDGGYSRD